MSSVGASNSSAIASLPSNCVMSVWNFFSMFIRKVGVPVPNQ